MSVALRVLYGKDKLEKYSVYCERSIEYVRQADLVFKSLRGDDIFKLYKNRWGKKGFNYCYDNVVRKMKYSDYDIFVIDIKSKTTRLYSNFEIK